MAYAAIEDVINAALRGIGYPKPIAEIYEGSAAAKAALDLYGQTRDELLQEQDWPFAFREKTLVATVGGVKPGGFTQQYDFPTDALRIRYIRGAIASPNNDPAPVRFMVFNDGTLATPKKCIATNQASAVAAYVARITDPATWDPAFERVFVSRLSEKLAFALKNDLNLARTRAQLSDQADAPAASDDASPMTAEARAPRGGQAQG